MRPRWLLGRTRGKRPIAWKLEGRFSEATYQALRDPGHDVEWLPGLSEATGHAGAIVRHPNGMLEGHLIHAVTAARPVFKESL